MKKTRIIGYPGPGGSRYYRLDCIAKYLNRTGRYEFLISPNALTDEELLWADIIIPHMLVAPEQIAMLWAYKMERGKKIITDRDDAIEILPDNPNYQINKDVHARSWSLELLKLADLVTVTTPVIRDEASTVNQNVQILPNYLDMELWEHPLPKPSHDGVVRLGWAGSITHREDMAMIKDAVIQVMRERPHTRLTICGDPVVHEWFTKALPGRVDYLQGVPTLVYPRYAYTFGFDIGLAPLVDNPFNRARSNLKFLEYAMIGAAGIYSPAAFASTVVHGKTGLLALSSNDWSTMLTHLIDDTDLRNHIRKEARAHVREQYDLAKHIAEWDTLYRAVSISGTTTPSKHTSASR